MPDRPATTALVREVIEATWPQRFSADELEEDLPLGADGLGLHSIEIIELIVACEERSGTRADSQLYEGTLTIAGIAQHLAYLAA